MPLPPWNETWEMLRLLLAPTLAVSVIVMLALRVLGGETLAPWAAAIAVVAGVMAGNHFKEQPHLQMQLERDRPLTVADMRTVLGWSLESKPTFTQEDPSGKEPPPMVPARFWLPWLALLALVVELIVGLPQVPSGAAWAARTLVAVLAGRLLTPLRFRNEVPETELSPWISLQSPATPWLLALAILLQWSILIALTRKWSNGTAPGALALCFASASLVLLLHHCASCMETAILCFGTLLGPALIAWKWPSVTGPALAAGVIFLPGLLLTSLPGSSKVPLRSFLLVGLAPLALAPLTLPFVARQGGWIASLAGLVLAMIPAGLGIALACQEESFDFDAV